MSDDSTRRSWNIATRNHNAHKGDQAALLRGGAELLFPEELDLLGDLTGKRLVHLQCNAGQDTLCLARRGAVAIGVDFSDEAVRFARDLSRDSGIAADFVQAEVVGWMHDTTERFDLAFTSYGTTSWLPDLDAWARGVARVLRPGGRFVYVEFHPVMNSVGKDLRLSGDDYFHRGPYVDPVYDYVAASGEGLGAVTAGATEENTIPSVSWQYGVGDVVSALAGAGLVLETLREYPYSNGCRLTQALVYGDGRRWLWPPGASRIPLMYGIAARRP